MKEYGREFHSSPLLTNGKLNREPSDRERNQIIKRIDDDRTNDLIMGTTVEWGCPFPSTNYSSSDQIIANERKKPQ